jgi:phage gp45-like
MDGTGITPVMNMGNDGGFGMNGLGGIFALLILLGIFNGGFNGFGGNGNMNAINADMQRGFDNQNVQAQTRDILAAVTGGTAQTIAASTQNASNAITAIKDGNAALIREFGNVETALTAFSGKQQECCCEILRAVDGVNYNSAINTAAINANTTAVGQKILDAIMGNRMADMQNQINALQLQNATPNVLRFPNAWTYAGGVFPPVQTTAA